MRFWPGASESRRHSVRRDAAAHVAAEPPCAAQAHPGSAEGQPRRRSQESKPRTRPQRRARAKDGAAACLRRDAARRARRIQFDLVWTGDYNGLINGEFGERAIAAVKAFQKRNGGKETGVLNPPERAALAAAVEAEAGARSAGAWSTTR